MATITWIGHSCFKVEEDGYSIIFDPYKDDSVPGLSPVREKAHQVLCSHDHGDHNAVETVELLPEKECPFNIYDFEVDHDDEGGAARGKNKIHILESEKSRIVHLGDLGRMLSEQELSIIGQPDILMIPVGGFYTIDANRAAVITEQIGAHMTVPMHYRSVEGEFGFDNIDTVYTYLAKVAPVMIRNTPELGSDEIVGRMIMVLQPQNQIKDLSRPWVR